MLFSSLSQEKDRFLIIKPRKWNIAGDMEENKRN